MPDTQRGEFPGFICSDCGSDEVCIRHMGPLVLPGVIGYFCQKCINARNAENGAGLEPRPLGTEPRELATA